MSNCHVCDSQKFQSCCKQCGTFVPPKCAEPTATNCPNQCAECQPIQSRLPGMECHLITLRVEALAAYTNWLEKKSAEDILANEIKSLKNILCDCYLMNEHCDGK